MLRRTVLLMQLPIPPQGPAPIRGNVPLAGAYLKLFAQQRGLADAFQIGLFPAVLANTLGDRALVNAILDRDPWMVGFTCYVWNIERTFWLAARLKEANPRLRIVLGGPEITADNAWVLQTPDYDFAVIGEGEQTFANLLLGLLENETVPPVPIAGLHVRGAAAMPAFRTPLPDLDRLGSPYLAGILDAADEQMLLLETTRGCVFKCKFCYYPKSYDKQYFVSEELVRSSLRHAQERGVKEVFLLDPTLNQRRDFDRLLHLLAEGNPGKRFSYFGELRAEGITEATARLLTQANFTEVEVGLQSIDPDAMKKMDRHNSLRAFERGVRAMMNEGIAVKVDLIVGLPGDSVESVRHGLHYLHDNGLCSHLQVFNLSILPGTDFRKEAGALGLKFQPRPPYYVLSTPQLDRADLFGLMEEAQDLFDIEFDAPPTPLLESADDSTRVCRVDLDNGDDHPLPAHPAQAFTLWLRSANLDGRRDRASALVKDLLDSHPFTTLQLVLEPTHAADGLTPGLLESLTAVCQSQPTYLDKFYALQPGRPNGAKRIVVLLPMALRAELDADWLNEMGIYATVVWRGNGESAAVLEPYEYAWMA